MGAQTIIPLSIPSNVVMGSPVVLAGGDQTIISRSIPTNVVVGIIPPQTGGGGGEQVLQLFLGNAFAKYLVPGGLTWPRQGAGGGGGGTGAAAGGNLTIRQTAIGRATCSFDLFVGDASGYVPQASQIVTLKENGTKIFAGCIKAVSSDPMPGYGLTSDSPIGFHVDCTDKSSICDNRVVIKTYPAGTDVQGMILDIVANFLNGEGITTQNVSVQDSLDTAMIFNHITVSNAFDQITALTGATWWVDFDGVLNFVVIMSAPAAPFALTAATARTPGSTFRNFVSTQTLIGYANKFYAISNLVVLPNGAQGQSGGGAITQAITSEQGSGYHVSDTVSVIGGDNNAVLQITGVTV